METKYIQFKSIGDQANKIFDRPVVIKKGEPKDLGLFGRIVKYLSQIGNQRQLRNQRNKEVIKQFKDAINTKYADSSQISANFNKALDVLAKKLEKNHQSISDKHVKQIFDQTRKSENASDSLSVEVNNNFGISNRTNQSTWNYSDSNINESMMSKVSTTSTTSSTSTTSTTQRDTSVVKGILSRKEYKKCSDIIDKEDNKQFAENHNLSRDEMMTLVVATGTLSAKHGAIPELVDIRNRNDQSRYAPLYNIIDNAIERLPTEKFTHGSSSFSSAPNDKIQDYPVGALTGNLRLPEVLKQGHSEIKETSPGNTILSEYSSDCAKIVMLNAGTGVNHYIAFPANSIQSIDETVLAKETNFLRVNYKIVKPKTE